MATHALQPPPVRTNALSHAFDAAYRDYADAAARRAHLLPSSTIAQKLAAGEAVERAVARLSAVRPPDLASLRHKLLVILREASTPRPVIDVLAGDVAHLSRKLEDRA